MDNLLDFIILICLGTTSFYRYFFFTNLNRIESNLDELSLNNFSKFIRLDKNYIGQFYWVPVMKKFLTKKSQNLKRYVNQLTIIIYIILIYLIVTNKL